MAQHIMNNPIVPGFYPDPSICRVGDDYYLINSSFALYPGIPVFHSRDLVNWKHICNALDRPMQHYVVGTSPSGGIMAPTIRYHDGVYYIIVANFHAGGNLMITATDPAGPWSDPYYLPDVPGIDASIFFDDDGKCYAQGTGSFDEDGHLVTNVAFGSPEMRRLKRGIWVCEFDVKTMKTVSEKKYVWSCALTGASSPEAPHIYKKDGWYYLIIAEGGTEHFHAVTVARCREVMGLYEPFKANPVLTHRHLGYDYPIANVGHADLVELPNGKWYAVMLGSRFLDGYHKNLGRETYICPVEWQDEWPVFCPMTGKVELSYPAPESLPWTPVPAEASFDDFEGDHLGLYWCTIGTPDPMFYSVGDSKLSLDLNPRAITDKPYKMDISHSGKVPQVPLLSFVGRRQRNFNFDFTAKMNFAPKANGETAGLLITHVNNHFFIELCMENDRRILRVRQQKSTSYGSFLSRDQRIETEIFDLAGTDWNADSIVLRISERDCDYSFYYGESADTLKPLFVGGDARMMNVPVDGGMVGALVGMYASANGGTSDNKAHFEWSEYVDLG